MMVESLGQSLVDEKVSRMDVNLVMMMDCWKVFLMVLS